MNHTINFIDNINMFVQSFEVYLTVEKIHITSLSILVHSDIVK